MKLSIASYSAALLICAACLGKEPPPLRSVQPRALAQSVSRLVASGGAALLVDDTTKTSLPAEVTAWMAKHKSALWHAAPSPFSTTPSWGVATSHDNRLFLHIMTWPDNGKLRFPRLHNSVICIRIDGQQTDVVLTPFIREWELTLPARPTGAAALLPIVEIELDSAPKVASSTPPLVRADAKGIIVLHARQAITHGTMLRYEPQPHKNTVGYWVRAKDWLEWLCDVPKPATYDVVLRYGCGKGQGGSEVVAAVGTEQLTFHVAATGGFQAWRTLNIGRVDLPAGPATFTVTPKRKAKNAIMDIQHISLIPVGAEQESGR